jgi:hypothetical protein
MHAENDEVSFLLGSDLQDLFCGNPFLDQKLGITQGPCFRRNDAAEHRKLGRYQLIWVAQSASRFLNDVQ